MNYINYILFAVLALSVLCVIAAQKTYVKASLSAQENKRYSKQIKKDRYNWEKENNEVYASLLQAEVAKYTSLAGQNTDEGVKAQAQLAYYEALTTEAYRHISNQVRAYHYDD